MGKLACVAALLSAHFGCGNSLNCEDPVGVGEGLEFGSGDTLENFIPFTPGQDVFFEPGFQGTEHVVIRIRVEGIVPGEAEDGLSACNPATRLQAFDQNGRQVSAANNAVAAGFGYSPSADGTSSISPSRLVVMLVEELDGLYGQPLTIEAELTDIEGTVRTGSIELVGQAPVE